MNKRIGFRLIAVPIIALLLFQLSQYKKYSAFQFPGPVITIEGTAEVINPLTLQIQDFKIKLHTLHVLSSPKDCEDMTELECDSLLTTQLQSIIEGQTVSCKIIHLTDEKSGFGDCTSRNKEIGPDLLNPKNIGAYKVPKITANPKFLDISSHELILFKNPDNVIQERLNQ